MAAQPASAASSVVLTGDPLIEAVTEAVRIHMSRYDGSHDFSHIQRVVGLAKYLTAEYEKDEEQQGRTAVLDGRLITLCALLHDVGDRKYLSAADEVGKADGEGEGEGEDGDSDSDRDPEIEADPGSAAVAAVLRRCGAPRDLTRLVPRLCAHVSWSHETRSPATAAATAALIADHPELAIVQDADRIESIGAVGIARVFAYGGARGGRSLQGSLDHFDEKLLHIAARTKTPAGRRLARDRTARLTTFLAWFTEEASLAAV